MNLDRARVQNEVKSAVRQAGFTLAPNAMAPLGNIDFAKLVEIHDHEEHFLRTTFIDTLIGLRRGRVRGPAPITADDVETALLMLGTAVARQEERTLTRHTRSIIKDACGFC